jgi:hypothetical protein
MSARDDDPADVAAVLQRIASASSVPPPWLEAAQQLRTDSTAEQRLAVYRAVRDSGWLTDEQGMYLVASLVEEMTDAEAVMSLRDMNTGIEALEREFGNAEGEPWLDERAAEEYEELSEQYQDAWDALLVGKLTAVGEQVIADLYRTDPDEFSRRFAAGEQQFNAKFQIHTSRSGDDLVSVASYVNVPRAELARNALESEGIPTMLNNVNLVLWQWEYSNATGGVSVQVRRGDAPHARALLAASRAAPSEYGPPWTCRSCGQRIAGEWGACWRCGSSRDGPPAESPADQPAATVFSDDHLAATQQLTRILGSAIIVLFVLLPLAFGLVPLALANAIFVGIVIYLMFRFSTTVEPAGEVPLALDSDRGSLQGVAQTKSEVSKAIVRRAWQAAVLGALGFPPLGFYALRLLWKLVGRDTPLGAADRWRVALAYILSLIAILYCLLFIGALLVAIFSVFARSY